jgi:hypothetical protein
VFERSKNDMKKTWLTINTILNKTTKSTKFPKTFRITETSNKTEIANEFNSFMVNMGPNLSASIEEPTSHYSDYLGRG